MTPPHPEDPTARDRSHGPPHGRLARLALGSAALFGAAGAAVPVSADGADAHTPPQPIEGLRLAQASGAHAGAVPDPTPAPPRLDGLRAAPTPFAIRATSGSTGNSTTTSFTSMSSRRLSLPEPRTAPSPAAAVAARSFAAPVAVYLDPGIREAMIGALAEVRAGAVRSRSFPIVRGLDGALRTVGGATGSAGQVPYRLGPGERPAAYFYVAPPGMRSNYLEQAAARSVPSYRITPRGLEEFDPAQRVERVVPGQGLTWLSPR